MRPINRDLTGQRFGRLLVQGTQVVQDRLKWKCACDCGQTTFVAERNLIRNHTRSCGCLRTELNRNRGKTPGRRHELEFSSWRNMLYKAGGNSSRKPYPIETSWQDSYETFYQDMGPKPTRRHRLHRIVPELGFVKGNCIWRAPRNVRNSS